MPASIRRVGRLPCPVGTDQAEYLSAAHIEAQRIDGAHAWKALREPLGHNRGLKPIRHCFAGARSPRLGRGQLEVSIRGHARFQFAIRVVDIDLDPIDKSYPLLISLHALRRKLRAG
jgi:hypothetical protein